MEKTVEQRIEELEKKVETLEERCKASERSIMGIFKAFVPLKER